MENCKLSDMNSASVIRNSNNSEAMTVLGSFYTECIGSDGKIKWTDESPNLVVNQGKNGMLDTYFAGTSYTSGWYCSLITAGTAISTSTYAVPTVTEVVIGVLASRVLMTWTAASGGSKASATVTCPIVGTATITGNMIVTATTPSSASPTGNTAASGGILFSSSNFSGGSKTVGNGDTLNVSYSLSV